MGIIRYGYLGIGMVLGTLDSVQRSPRMDMRTGNALRLRHCDVDMWGDLAQKHKVPI